MQVGPEGQRLIRSASHWMLGVVVLLSINMVVSLLWLRNAPVVSVVGAVVCGWLAFSLARAAYAFSRRSSPGSLRAGSLGLRSFFRAHVTSFFLGLIAAVASQAISLEVEWEDAGVPDEEVQRGGLGSPLEVELSKILVAGLRRCSDRKSERCRDASEAAGAAMPPMYSMPKFFSYAHPKTVCQRGNFAQLEFDVAYTSEDGLEIRKKGDAVASFARTDTGKWFLMVVDPKGESVEGCEELPYHDASYARTAVVSRNIGWATDGAQDAIDLSKLWRFSCVIERIEVVVDPGRAPVVLEPECWFEEGWPVEPPAESRVVVDAPSPPEVSVRVEFQDGVRAARATIENPRGGHDE